MPQSRPPTDFKQPPDAAIAVTGIPFHDHETAKLNLARVAQRVSPGLAAALPALLLEVPDPDTALVLFDRLLGEAAGEIVRLLDRHNFLAHYALVVFGYSRFLGETLIQNTDLLYSFLREKHLDRSFPREEFHQNLARFRSRSFENDVALLLARFRRREYVRIMLRDVLRIAPLAETTAEISALSDVLIEQALREAESQLERRYGKPQHLDGDGRLHDIPFAILSLGKLGGNELNYSSDVDLLFLYGDGNEPPDVPISHREYFVRLAQLVTDILSRMTREGTVFRIDLRLRPEGGQGELAINLSHALQYYAHTAQDWERQAMIKLRHCAGDTLLARDFIRGVQPHVYTQEVNVAAIETALQARRKMRTRGPQGTMRQPQGNTINVKIDRGGIRDIEFLVQCLQRVYGGSEPWLHSGGTMFSLQKLHDKGHISGKDFHELASAYEFLRHLEHRLQLRQGQQTHCLPVSETELGILQRSLLPAEPEESNREPMDVLVRRRMGAVAEIYERIIHRQQTHQHLEGSQEFQLQTAPELSRADHSNQQILDLLAADAPALYAIASSELSGQVRKNLFRFLGSAFTSSERYVELLRHPEAFHSALVVFGESDYLTELLIRHPEEIATLAALRETPPHGASGHLFENCFERRAVSGDQFFSYIAGAPSSFGEKLSLLRKHYRHRLFAEGARDITEHRDIYESLAAASTAAEDVLSAAFALAGEPEGLAVMALGRLGTGEFDLLSDADVLFICEEDCERAPLLRAAEQIMQALAAYTRDGMVFPIDTRLRPHGGDGELLISPTQLQRYFRQDAQPWEALMYTKLRLVAGAWSLGDRARNATSPLFDRFSENPGFAASVREMRAKLENAESGAPSLKSSPGGMYDIDFLVSYLMVKHSAQIKSGNIRDRLWRCAESGWIANSEAAALDHAAELLRTTEHVLRLVVGRARKWLPGNSHARQVTEKLASQILRREFAGGLELELLRTCRQVREIYDKLLR